MKMDKINQQGIVDISEFNILRQANYAWSIPVLSYIKKEQNIRVKIGEQVFSLVSLWDWKFIPWFPSRWARDSQGFQ